MQATLVSDKKIQGYETGRAKFTHNTSDRTSFNLVVVVVLFAAVPIAHVLNARCSSSSSSSAPAKNRSRDGINSMLDITSVHSSTAVSCLGLYFNGLV